MPNPPQGMPWILEERISETGEVSRSMNAAFPDLGQDDERKLPDLDAHYTLWGGYPAGHQYLIEAGKVIRIEPSAAFTKFEVLIFNNVSAFIGLDKDAGPGPGQYDRRSPGSAVDDQRCRPHRIFTILFSVVPADPVEVHLYGGRPAEAK